MIDSYFRSRYQTVLVDPIVRINRISPHFITVCALVLGVSLTPLLAFGYVKLSLLFLLLSGYLDTLDGSVARALGQASPQGAVFDIVADRIVESAVILGLFLVDPEVRGLLCLLMLASVLICVTSFLVVGIFLENAGEKSFHYSPGVMERTEAFIFFGLMILFPVYFGLLATVFIGLVLVTALIRVWQFAMCEDE